jgi:RNA polymerase sigma-70 factor (ECF subfamily)
MSLQEDRTLAELIAAAQRDEETAYAGLYAYYADTLHRYLYVRTGDAHLAEELLGDVWLRVVEHLPKFHLPSDGADLAFSKWLYRIARNLVINHYQRAQRRQQIPLDEGQPTDDPPVETIIERQEEHAELYAALEELTTEQREIVVLRFFEGRTSADVANITERSEGAVKSLQHRALSALARMLRNGGAEERRS